MRNFSRPVRAGVAHGKEQSGAAKTVIQGVCLLQGHQVCACVRVHGHAVRRNETVHAARLRAGVRAGAQALTLPTPCPASLNGSEPCGPQSHPPKALPAQPAQAQGSCRGRRAATQETGRGREVAGAAWRGAGEAGVERAGQTRARTWRRRQERCIEPRTAIPVTIRRLSAGPRPRRSTRSCSPTRAPGCAEPYTTHPPRAGPAFLLGARDCPHTAGLLVCANSICVLHPPFAAIGVCAFKQDK